MRRLIVMFALFVGTARCQLKAPKYVKLHVNSDQPDTIVATITPNDETSDFETYQISYWSKSRGHSSKIGSAGWIDNAAQNIECMSNRLNSNHECIWTLQPQNQKFWTNKYPTQQEPQYTQDYIKYDFKELVTLEKIKFSCHNSYGSGSAVKEFRFQSSSSSCETAVEWTTVAQQYPWTGKKTCQTSNNVFSFARQTGRCWRLLIDSNYQSSRETSIKEMFFYGTTSSIYHTSINVAPGDRKATINRTIVAPGALTESYVLDVQACSSTACSLNKLRVSTQKPENSDIIFAARTEKSNDFIKKSLYNDYQPSDTNMVKASNWFYNGSVARDNFCTASNERHINPAEERRRYSSVWEENHQNTASRLDTSDGWTAWVACQWCHAATVKNWVEMDASRLVYVNGVVVQSRSSFDQWPTKIRVYVSHDRVDWADVDNSQIFNTGIVDRTTKQEVRFSKSYVARYVKVQVIAYNNYASMRVGILGCDSVVPRIIRTFSQHAITKTLAYGWGNRGQEILHYRDTCSKYFVPLLQSGAYGSKTMAKVDFNQKIKLASPSNDGTNAIMRRECRDCKYTHKIIYYKRLTPIPSSLSMFDMIKTNFVEGANNRMNIDFELYNSWADVVSGQNHWEKGSNCEFVSNIGFPGECGPYSKTLWQWEPKQKHVEWSLFNVDETNKDMLYPSKAVRDAQIGCRELHGPFSHNMATKFNLTLESGGSRRINVRFRFWMVGSAMANVKVVLNSNITLMEGSFGEKKTCFDYNADGFSPAAATMDFSGGFTGYSGSLYAPALLTSSVLPEPWRCAAYPTTQGNNYEKCNNGNDLNNGYEYRFNQGRDGDKPGVCGIGGCWCCVRPRIRKSESHQKCYYDIDKIVDIEDPFVEVIFETSNSKFAIVNPGESDRSYSGSKSREFRLSYLDSPRAWVLETNNKNTWLQIDLRSIQSVAGVVSQGRHNHDHWTTRFKVQVSRTGVSFEYTDNERVYIGNSDRNTKVTNLFDAPYMARYVRVLPQEGTGKMKAMRAAVVVMMPVKETERGSLSQPDRAGEDSYAEKNIISTEKFLNGVNGWNCVNGVFTCSNWGKFCRNNGKSEEIKKTFSVTPGKYNLRLDILLIDSWDGEKFSIWVNGNRCYHSGKYRHSDHGTVKKCATHKWRDKMVYGVECLNFNVPGTSLEVKAKSHLSSNWADEALAITNVKIWSYEDIDRNLFFRQRIEFEDFSNGMNGWGCDERLACNGYGRVCRRNDMEIEKVYTVEPGTYTVKMNLFSLDSYDNEWNKVYINGEECFSKTYSHSDSGRAHLCGNSNHKDYRDTVTCTKTVYTNILKVEIKSNVAKNNFNDESMGINNIEIFKHEDDVSPPTIDSWYGIDRLAIDEILPTYPSKATVMSNKFNVSLISPSHSTTSGNYYRVEQLKQLLYVKNLGNKLMQGNSIGINICPPQFRLSFDLKLFSLDQCVNDATTCTKQYNIFRITASVANEGPASRILALFTKGEHFELETHTDSDNPLQVSPGRSLRELVGKEKHVEIEVSNGLQTFKIDDETWSMQSLNGATEALSFCEIYASDNFYAPLDARISNLLLEEVLAPRALPNTTKSTVFKNTMAIQPNSPFRLSKSPANYEISFTFQLKDSLPTALDVLRVGYRRRNLVKGYGQHVPYIYVHHRQMYFVVDTYSNGIAPMTFSPRFIFPLMQSVRVKFEIFGRRALIFIDDELVMHGPVDEFRPPIEDAFLSLPESPDFILSNVHIAELSAQFFANDNHTIILNDTFSLSTDGWSCGSTTSCGSLGKVCGGYQITAKNDVISKTVTGLEHSSTYVVSLDYVKIDNWDEDEKGYVSLNGADCWVKNLGEELSTDVDQCGSGATEEVNRVYCIHTADTDTIVIRAWSNVNHNSEAFAIDNVKIMKVMAFRNNPSWHIKNPNIAMFANVDSNNITGVEVPVRVKDLEQVLITSRISSCNNYGCADYKTALTSPPSNGPANVVIKVLNDEVLRVELQPSPTADVEGVTHYRLNPPRDCLEISETTNSYQPGLYFIQPDTLKQDIVRAYCDLTKKTSVACDHLPGGMNNGKCLPTEKVTNPNLCLDHGMDIVIPRDKTHLENLFINFGMLQSINYYFKSVPGVFSNEGNKGVSSPKTMSSAGGTHYRSIDGRQWFLRDSIYSEPNGDYHRKCWLGSSSGPSKWEVLASEDFSVSNGGFLCEAAEPTACGTWGEVCGFAGKGEFIEKTYTIEHKGKYKISMDFLKIDSFDSEIAYMSINGKECWQKTFHYSSNEPNVCANSNYGDLKHRISCTVDITRKDKLTLKLWANLNEVKSNEKFGIDNVLIEYKRFSRFRQNDVSDYKFNDYNCHYRTSRYVCSTNTFLPDDAITSSYLRQALYRHITLDDAKNGFNVTSYKLLTKQIMVSVSACNAYGCSAGTDKLTKVPSKIVTMSFGENTGLNGLFEINISRVGIDIGGLRLANIHTIVRSYDNNSTYVIAKNHSCPDDTENIVLSLQPPLTTNTFTQVSARGCNSLGCSPEFAVIWNIGVNPHSFASEVRYDLTAGKVSVGVNSIVDVGKSPPTTTSILLDVADKVALNASLGPHVAGQLEVASSINFTVPFGTMLNFSDLYVPYVGAIQYNMFVQHCVTVGTRNICSEYKKILETETFDVPHAPEMLSANSTGVGGVIMIEFQPPSFWGKEAFSRGRKYAVEVFQYDSFGNVLSWETPFKTDIQTYDSTKRATVRVTGLFNEFTYKFRVSALNGKLYSSWSPLTNVAIRPPITAPGKITMLPFREEDKYPTSLNVRFRITDDAQRGSKMLGYDIQAFKANSACGLTAITWDENTIQHATNVTEKVTHAYLYEAYKNKIGVVAELAEQSTYAFRVRAYNLVGAGEWSDCCTAGLNVANTTRKIYKVRVSPRASQTENSGRRLSRRKLNGTVNDNSVGPISEYLNNRINQNIGTVFELNEGEYVDSELSFAEVGMAIKSATGKNNVVLDCNRQRCFNLMKEGTYVPVAIEGITFLNGLASASKLTGRRCTSGNCGAAIYIDENANWVKQTSLDLNPAPQALSIRNCIFKGHESKFGGAIFVAVAPANLVLSNVLFEDNVAKASGGAVLLDSVTAVFDENAEGRVQFQNNFAMVNGGAIAVQGSKIASVIDMNSVTFRNNAARGDGGAIFLESSKMTAKKTNAHNHSAGNIGGFIKIHTSNLEISDGELTDMTSSYGSVACYGSQLAMLNMKLSNGVSKQSGGGIYGLLCSAEIRDSNILNCMATEADSSSCMYGNSHGGALSLVMQSSLTIQNTNFDNNCASGNGGAIFMSEGLKYNLEQAVLDGNEALRGGAIYSESSPLNLKVVNVTNNRAIGGGGGGIMWTGNGEDDIPILDSVGYESNQAFYGNNVATDAKNISIFPSKVFVRNDGNFNLTVNLLDYYGETYVDAKITHVLYVSTISMSSKLITETFSVTLLTMESQAVFESLQLVALPGTYHLEVNSGNNQIQSSRTTVVIAACNPGENIIADICTQCPPGFYQGCSALPKAVVSKTAIGANCGIDQEPKCKLCMENFIQPNSGQVDCTECDEFHTANEGRTTCSPPNPEPPQNVELKVGKSEKDGSLIFSQLEVSWAKDPAALSYDIALCDSESDCFGDDGGETARQDQINISTGILANTYTFSKLMPTVLEKTYYIRVRSVIDEYSVSTTTLAKRWKSIIQCSSDSEYLLAEDQDLTLWECQPCPSGSRCNGPIWQQEIVTLPGYSRVEWAPTIMSPPLKCPYEYACSGGNVMHHPTKFCVNGTEGPLCAICSDGYGYSFGECTACTMQNVGLQLAFAFALILVVLTFVWYIRKKLRKYQSVWRDLLRVIKMNVDFLQITSAVPELIHINWPPIFNEFLVYFDFVNADFLSLTGASCVNGVNFNIKFLGMSLLPLLGMLIGIYIYIQGRKKLQNEERRREEQLRENPGMKATWERELWVENHKYLEETFRNIDIDRSGCIDATEFKNMLQSFGYKVDQTLASRIIQGILNDSNATTISELAFKAAYESGKLQEILKDVKTRGKGAVHDNKGLRRWSENRKVMAKALAETVQILLLIHTPVTKKVFLYFNCHPMYGKYFMRSDYSIECWYHVEWISFAPIVFFVMFMFVFGFPGLILFYIYTHRHILHSAQVKEKIGFLYDRFNGGAEAWEVHEIIRKAFLTGVIVFIPDPVLQAAVACVISSFACCTLNYFKPHKNKLLFWIAQGSFITTLLVFIFAIVLMASKSASDSASNNIIGVCLIVLNVAFVLLSFVGITTQIVRIVKKVNKLEREGKVKISPLEAEEGKKLKFRVQKLIESKVPIAARHMLEYVRETYGASSTQYSQVTVLINDLANDRIHHRSELQRRIELIFRGAKDDVQDKVSSLATDLWLVD